MAKSFVFRDEKGRLCGYLLQREDGLWCRIDHAADDARLTIIAKTGRLTTYALPQGKIESVFEDASEEISAAYVWTQHALLMDTGPIARQRYAQMTAEQKKKDTPVREDRETPAQQKRRKETHDDEVRDHEVRDHETYDHETYDHETYDDQAHHDEKQEAHCTQNPQEAYPQRRWPPPVLMENPVYLEGRWIEKP